jgi:hypothetical protein
VNTSALLAKKQFDADIAALNKSTEAMTKQVKTNVVRRLDGADGLVPKFLDGVEGVKLLDTDGVWKMFYGIPAQLDFLERQRKIGKYAETKSDPVADELAKVTREHDLWRGGAGGENPFNRTLHKAAY